MSKWSVESSEFSGEVPRWLDDPDYNELKHAASVMKVGNDTAERGIALMQLYNSSLTRNEERPVWARGRCRISPPRFLAECCKRQLN